MAKLELRPLLRADLPALLWLAREAAPALDLTRHDLEWSFFHDPRGRSELTLAALAGGRVAGLGCAVPDRSRRPEGAYVKLLAVAPRWRRRGIGSALLDALEDGLRPLGARWVELDGAAPVYLQPGVPTDAGAALSFFRRRGYEPFEARRSLTAPLDSVRPEDAARIAALEAEGYVVRRAKRCDEAAVCSAIAAAFSEAWAAEVAFSLRRRGASTHLAFAGGRFAAFATAGLWARNAFGPMGTVPEHAGRGLGRVLLGRCLDDLRRAGARQALIAWVGPEEFYRRWAGAKGILRYTAFRKQLP
jgi:GNAT superfamily N-acetyltransferase